MSSLDFKVNFHVFFKKFFIFKTLQWQPPSEEESCDNLIPGFKELKDGVQTELRLAKQEEEQLVARILAELQKTEKTLGIQAKSFV